MKPETLEEFRERHLQACIKIVPLGWVPCGWFVFYKSGKYYDLSAANLEELERIEREGLFLKVV